MGGKNIKTMDKMDKMNNIQKKIYKKIEEASQYKIYIITAVILFGVMYIAYKCSHSYRISRLFYDMEKMNAYLNIKSKLNFDGIRELNLGDFYISSAYRPYMGSNQMFEYADLKVTEKIIKSGARCMYIDVFNSNMGYDAEPVISTGYNQGQWKLTLNTVMFDDFCKLIAYACFSAGYVNNYTDPFILLLNLNNNGNINCLNKIKRIIYKRLKRYLLDNSYTYSSVNIMKEPIKNFMKKVIIMTSSGYQNSELEELINYTWDREELKMITNESLDKNLLDPSVIKLDPYELKQYNKDNMTIVTPNKFTFFTHNYNPDILWNAGCQIVCINYQKIDANFDTYISKFRTESFIAKPLSQRGSGTKEKINLQSVSLNSNDSDDPYKYQNERCPELPLEDDFDETSLMNYKDVGSQHGLCFPSMKEKCHCDNDKIDDDRDCYFYKYGNLNGTIHSQKTPNLCCANNRIVNPSNIDLYSTDEIKQMQNRKTLLGAKKVTTDTEKAELTALETKLANPVVSSLSYISKTDCSSSYGIRKTGTTLLSSQVKEINLTLSDGKDKFDKDGTESKMWLCPIEEERDFDNKHVCLIDQNNNNNCPKGWDYNAKIDGTREKICCRNT